jgi:hypothetical protein
MNSENHIRLTPRMHKALDELKGLITARFPQAAFVVEEGFDPEGVYLITTVEGVIALFPAVSAVRPWEPTWPCGPEV